MFLNLIDSRHVRYTLTKQNVLFEGMREMAQPILLTIGSFNTWAGSIADHLQEPEHVINYLVKQAKVHDIMGLYEVHMPRGQCSTRFANVLEPKGRLGLLDLELGERLTKRLKKTHLVEFVPHFTQTAFHDCEATDEPVDYGNLVLIKKELMRRPYKISIERVHIFGTGHLNSECSVSNRGRPASRNAIIMTVWFSGQPITILFVHGLWTRHGKVDMHARMAQSVYMIRAFTKHKRRHGIEDGTGGANIIIGDLNLTSTLEALKELITSQNIFGKSGGCNLLEGVNTRTRFYPADKPTREANFVLVSNNIYPSVQSCTVDRDVPSDHAFIQLVLNLSLDTS